MAVDAPNWNIEALTYRHCYPISPPSPARVSTDHCLGEIPSRSEDLEPFSTPSRRSSEPAMTGKAKPKKHTAKEIASKVDAATTNRGGGKAGQADRSGVEKGGHAKYECPLCKTTCPDLKSMQIHHDARHPKIPFDESKLNNLHASNSADSAKSRPGVRGSFKK